VFETCVFPCLSPFTENPAFRGLSINSKFPIMFHDLEKREGLPSLIRTGPI